MTGAGGALSTLTILLCLTLSFQWLFQYGVLILNDTLLGICIHSKTHSVRYFLFDRRVAEVFEGVFVLTGILIKGVTKYESRRREPLGGSGGMPILKSRGPEMLLSALCTSIFLTRWSVKLQVFLVITTIFPMFC